MSFASCSASGAKDPDNVVSLDKEYQQKPDAVGMAHDDLPLFELGMIRIIVDACQRISENAETFFK